MAQFVLPDTVHGGSITVSGGSLQEAQQNAANATGASLSQQQGGGTFGSNTFVGGGGGGGGWAGGGGGSSSGLSGLAQFAAQTSGVTDKQLAQQKAEFDAQLQFAQQQMQQLGIPQLQINQYVAALQQQQFISQLAQVQAQETGYWVQPNLPTLSPTGGANQPQATLGAGQGVQTLAGQLQQAQLSGMYQGAPTEAAREFNAQNALAQGQLGQQYLATAAQLQGPQNTFQLSNYLRGAQGNPNVPAYLQALSQNIGMPAFQATGSTAPTPASAAGLAGQLGGSQSATPGWNYNQTLGTIQNIMNAGAQKLAPGSLEQLTPDELQAFGSGLGAAGGSLPSFMQQYAQSRIGQQAPTAMTSLA
jgi:hypothetical protein